MRVSTAILYPFAVLYDIVTSTRNRLYDLSLKPTASFDIPVISVGNLNVGGTGKTPMIEHLIRLLSGRYRVATLSRGYKRKTRGFRIAASHDTAATIGDEPYQFYKKYKDKAVVSVGEERALAISSILHEFPDTEVILLDDAFQHRRVRPSFQILLTVYDNLFTEDLLLPAGRLRESKEGAKRADVIVVTKCPRTLQPDEMITIEKSIQRYSSKPVFFSMIHYGEAVEISATGAMLQQDVVLVSGLANASHLKEHVQKNYRLKAHFEFADHHMYSVDDVRKILASAESSKAHIITSEKDAVKLMAPEFESIISKSAWFYLPIEIEFVKSGEDFDEMVLNAVVNART